MDKILLILQREYLSRVKKKSFIILTFLTPLLFVGMIFFVAWFGTQKGDQKVIEVLDESGILKGKLQDKENIHFEMVGGSLEKAKEDFKFRGSYGLLYIPQFDLDDPAGFTFYSENNPSFDLVNTMDGQISEEIRQLRLAKQGLSQELLDKLKVSLSIKTLNVSTGDEKESNAGLSFGIGYAASFLIYIFIFLYGAQVMRGVIEEKSSRIVEVIISSAKPFHLMMGKVLGVAAVGLTQFLLWVILSTAVSSFAGGAMGLSQMQQLSSSGVDEKQVEKVIDEGENKMASVISAVQDMPLGQLLFSFVFYFLGGYLLYGALFAMVGSAVDSEADSQQFMLPITIPLLLAIFSLSAVLTDPNGQLAFWLSMVPFTSPVVMMGRIPYGVPGWQLALSMVLLVGGFILTTWFASRVYRVGILMHGTKVNYKVLIKWFIQS